MSVKVVISGAGGRMSGAVMKRVVQTEGFELVAALEIAGHPAIGQDPGPSAGAGSTGLSITAPDDYFNDPVEGAVFVDFTNPEASLENTLLALETGHMVVNGTTGFSQEQLDEIAMAAEKTGRGCVVSPNFSVGVNVFWDASVRLAKLLKGYDIEILEAHHNQKKDAPSGTAKKAAQLIAEAIGAEGSSFVYGREGVCPRKGPREEIGVMTLRAGDIFGDHIVLYAGNSERIELKHQLHSRDALASGCLIAIEWITGHNDGKLHDMKEVLGL
jgi:4-hydroxy-tetrahydrodipicolinate reductase